MIKKKLRGESAFDWYCMAGLMAVELLMSFTSLGYIHIPPISITIVYLPILVAGCLLGPGQSVALGFVFGLTSMYKASASYVLPADAVFSPFLSGAPVNSLLLSVGTRLLFGLAIGAAFYAAKKSGRYRLWFGAISIFAPKVHSLIVYTAMGFLFPELGYRYSSALHWDMDDLIYSSVCVVTVEALWAMYHSELVQNIKFCIDQSIYDPYAPESLSWFFAAFEFFILGTAVFVVDYFSQRESYMLERHGILVSETIAADLVNLQVQFLIASLALNALSVILLISTYKYMAYKKYRGEMDELTGVMGRRMFLYHCEKAQKAAGADSTQVGWFLFVDADYFKEVNDSLGHPAGDQVLKAIAANLQTVFGGDGAVGRLGGDEFAFILEKPLLPEELSRKLECFLAAVGKTLADRTISCSIGAYQFVYPQKVSHLLEETDRILYQAKEKGRACYVMRACQEA